MVVTREERLAALAGLAAGVIDLPEPEAAQLCRDGYAVRVRPAPAEPEPSEDLERAP